MGACRGAIVGLVCLLSLLNGTTQALCLDLGGHCSPPSAAERCHEREPGGGMGPSCGTCVDILVPEEAAARCGRPDIGLAAPPAHAAGAAINVFDGPGAVVGARAASLHGSSRPGAALSPAVLRI